jgi:hypothetical protein
MKTFNAIEALTIMRVFVRIDQQVSIAYREERVEDARSLAKLSGALSYRVYGVSRWAQSPLSEVAA